MAVPNESWTLSNITASDHARLHVGPQNVYNTYSDDSHLSSDERQRLREDAILSSLAFPEIDARKAAVDDPCESTFDWVFDAEVTTNERHRSETKPNVLPQWLSTESGMFFVAGKAGSGKSTFMRYLAGHQKTRHALQMWANIHGRSLTVVSHFFWCSGSELQCSQEGLWRSVLLALLKENRTLIMPVCSGRLSARYSTLEHLQKQPWNRKDLFGAMLQLLAQMDVQNLAICLFLDGLDEFEGDEVRLTSELKRLLSMPFVKICASSRPRNLFDKTFGGDGSEWKLALHDLTERDITQLARSELYGNECFLRLVGTEQRRQQFIATIGDAAKGVFVWVVLVVREMLREAQQAGSVNELQDRLDELPVELSGSDGMFQRIVERSDPRYRKYMARLLLVMLNRGHQYLYWEDVYFLHEEEKDADFASRECLQLDDKYRQSWDQDSDEDSSESTD